MLDFMEKLQQSAYVLFIIGIFDIIVVAYLIYRILILIRGTRAQNALVGLGILGLGFFGSKWLGLKTLFWLLDNFIGSILLIVIVVFQHDIRRGLSRVGQRPLMGTPAYGQGAYLVDELTRAAEIMAKEGIGAIIVIERDADLGEIAESGIRVDARISTALLQQIFTPPGPLHDGAVVIQQGRVMAAAVFLPLSQNQTLEQSLGTRHRAALGVTEELDALAIIVSEQRRQISFAEHGQLHRDIDVNNLRLMLQQRLAPQNLTVWRRKRGSKA